MPFRHGKQVEHAGAPEEQPDVFRFPTWVSIRRSEHRKRAEERHDGADDERVERLVSEHPGNPADHREPEPKPVGSAPAVTPVTGCSDVDCPASDGGDANLPIEGATMKHRNQNEGVHDREYQPCYRHCFPTLLAKRMPVKPKTKPEQYPRNYCGLLQQQLAQNPSFQFVVGLNGYTLTMVKKK